MILEFGYLAPLFLSGAIVLRAFGASPAASACLGYLAGISVYVVWGTLQLATSAPTTPYLTMALTAATAGGIAIWKRRDLRDAQKTALYMLAGLAVIAAAVFLLRHFHLVKWHTDSFRYISIGALIEAGNFDEVGLNFLRKRYPAIPLLHAPANIQGEFYIRALTPLIALSVLMSIAWFYVANKARRLEWFDWAVLSLALFLLVTMNRFVWNAFYLNGHLLFGALVLVIAGAGWLMRDSSRPDGRALLALQVMCAAAGVFTRPEAFLCVAIALAPTALDPKIAWRRRAVSLVAFGLSSILMHGFLLLAYLRGGGDVQTHLLAGVAIGIACIVGAAFLRWKPISAWPLAIMTFAEAVLWAALAAMYLREPTILQDSLRATAHNLGGAGAWGYAPITLALLIVFAAALCRQSGLSWLRFPVTASAPLYLLFAYMRDSAFRIGEGDSLNRMFIQIVPLAILYIAAAGASRDWGFVSRRRSDADIGAPAAPARAAK